MLCYNILYYSIIYRAVAAIKLKKKKIRVAVAAIELVLEVRLILFSLEYILIYLTILRTLSPLETIINREAL
jgi:hypothetical protein